MPKLLILGAGGHGGVVADAAAEVGDWDEIRFLDDSLDKPGVIGQFRDLDRFNGEFTHAFVALGSNQARLKWLNYLVTSGWSVPCIVHPGSTLSRSAQLGTGVFVAAGATLNNGVKIGDGAICNTNCNIDHDVLLGQGSAVGPGANVAGGVSIGSGCWIGIGATVIENLEIGDGAYVAAGAVVIRNVKYGARVAGVPAMEMNE